MLATCIAKLEGVSESDRPVPITAPVRTKELTKVNPLKNEKKKDTSYTVQYIFTADPFLDRRRLFYISDKLRSHHRKIQIFHNYPQNKLSS